jgi:hypothetical protein
MARDLLILCAGVSPFHKERDMVGKPNFPEDVDAREDLKGSAAGTTGFTALDKEREASLADEGGASAALIESQEVEPLHIAEDDGSTKEEGRAHLTVLVAALSFATAALGVLAYRRWLA